jgi:hypothetical protein
MSDEFKPSKKRSGALRDKKDRKKYKGLPVGKKAQPEDTPLYVKCPNCTADKAIYDDAGNCTNCLCDRGFIETGFTQERYDRLIKKTDRLIVALDDALTNLDPSRWLMVLRAEGLTEADVLDARSRL